MLYTKITKREFMNKKMIYYGILLGLLAIVAGFGLYNIVSSVNYKNNELTFKVNNEEAYFQASGDYYYGDTDVPTSTYVGAKYSQDDYYQGVVPSFSVWSLGTSEFKIDDANPDNNVTTLKYVISIKNLNTEKSLNINTKNVAVHPYAHFITTIHYESTSFNGVIFSNDPDNSVNKVLYYNLDKTSDADDKYVSIPNQALVSGDTLKITITLTLNTKTKEIRDFDNNITFELSAIDAE